VPFIGIISYCLLGLHQASALLAKATTSNFYLQVALCWIPVWIICTAASLLVSCYSFYLDRKFGLVKSDLRTWLRDSLKANTLALVLGGMVMEIAFASNTLSPVHGWIWAGILCSILFLGVAGLLPWLLSLFYPMKPLSNDSLRERLTRLATRAGIQVGRISEWHVSGRTRKANALVAGVGRARRILLTDTLISELSEDEVEAMVGHELGHCVYHHIRTRVLLQNVIYCGIFWVIDAAVRNGLVWFADDSVDWTDLRLLPGIFLFWAIGHLQGTLLLAALARRQEKAADLYGWSLIGRVEPFITAIKKLTDLNLIVYDKTSQWRYLHPATTERIAAAQQYAKAHGEVIGGNEA